MNPVMQQQMQGMTPDQAAQMQQQMLAQQQQQQMLPAVDIGRLNAMDPAERRQEIGNNIYSVIQQIYGDAAGKITGMLLDNDRIVDPIQLVTNMTYLQQKANEAWSLLQQQQPDPSQMTPEQQQQMQMMAAGQKPAQ